MNSKERFLVIMCQYLVNNRYSKEICDAHRIGLFVSGAGGLPCQHHIKSETAQRPIIDRFPNVTT